MICDTQSSCDAFAHQIWNSYLKEHWIYAPESMQFLETRSEFKFKVTVIQLWNRALCHPRMHPHTKFEIPISNNTRDMLRTQLSIKTRSGQCQGHSDPKMVRDTPLSQDVSTHQIWNSYIKEYRRYALDTKREGQTDRQ